MVVGQGKGKEKKWTNISGLLWSNWIREQKDQHQRFPTWSATVRRTEALNYGQYGHQFQNTPGAHSSQALLSWPKYTTWTWRQQNHLLNEFLPPRSSLGSRTLHGCIRTYYCGECNPVTAGSNWIQCLNLTSKASSSDALQIKEPPPFEVGVNAQTWAFECALNFIVYDKHQL